MFVRMDLKMFHLDAKNDENEWTITTKTKINDGDVSKKINK